MDADVTDSAGTPADPNRPAENGPQEDSGSQDGPGSQEKPEATTPQEDNRTDPAHPAPTGSADAGETAGADGTTGDSRAAGAGGPAGTTGDGEATGDGTWAPRPTSGFPPGRFRRHWVRWSALAASFLVLVASGAGWWLYHKLDANIKTDTGAAAELKAYEKERPAQVVLDAENILLIGSDSRAGDNRKYGRDDGGSQRSDTTILLHLAADRKSATAMSVPRDLMVEIPRCRTKDGKTTRKQYAQFNWAFEFGGTACTIRTIERMTGVRVDHYMVIDFNGFKDMVNAVNGVEVCLKKPVDDHAAHLKLPAGRQKLDGEQALGYVRARKSIGNGSDTERMERQQKFLGALVNKMQSNGVLLNPARLYPVLDAATKSLTTDPGLNSLKDLYDLVRGMRNVPTDKVQFLTVPRQPYHLDPNRDELIQPDADKLFEQLREDVPVHVAPADEIKPKNAQGSHSSGAQSSDSKPGDTDADPAPTPTYSGSSAADDPCKQ